MSATPRESLLERLFLWFDGIRADARIAFRSLRRSPVLSLAAALTLALGIGVNTAMFGVIDALFLRPPAHVVDPDRVVRIDATPGSIRTWPRYLQFRDQARTMSVAAFMGPRPMSLGHGGEARSIQATLVTGDYFPLLGVTPLVGRFFSAQEDRPGSGAALAVVSAEFYRRHLGGTPAALGTTLQLGQRVYTVIGVLPDGFFGLNLGTTDLWLPMSTAAPDLLWREVLSCENCSWLQLIGRLHPGVQPAAALAEATTLFQGHRVQRSDSSTRITFGPLHQPVGIDATRGAQLSTWLAAACAIVLLIACVNVANLLLARAARRQREMAVRMALGSRRGQLIRQLYLESGWLALLGGAAALLAAIWTGPLLRTLLLPAVPAAPLDVRVLLFTSAVVAVTILIAGLAPALYTTTPDLASALKTGVREGGGSRTALQSLLLAGQVALTVMLLTGAGLFFRSLSQVRALRLGFDPGQVMIVSPHLEPVRPSRGESDAELARMRERVARVPGVTSTSLSIGAPFRYSFGTGFVGPGVDSLPDMEGPYISAVSPEYFATLGTAVVQGRGITSADDAGARRVLVVSQSFARIAWPGQNPIGRCLSIAVRSAPCREVVGVVEDGRQDRMIQPSAQTFVPLAQADDASLEVPITSILVRTEGPATALLGPVQRALQTTAADLPWITVEPMETLLADQLRPWQLGASLFGLFGALALVLGAVGVYGVLSYAMSQRTHELGVRAALGAGRAHLLGLVVSRGVKVTMSGVVVGTVGALLAGRALSSLVYGVSPYDPRILGGVALILLLVSVGASFLPAWRAARIDPMTALREE